MKSVTSENVSLQITRTTEVHRIMVPSVRNTRPDNSSTSPVKVTFYKKQVLIAFTGEWKYRKKEQKIENVSKE